MLSIPQPRPAALASPSAEPAQPRIPLRPIALSAAGATYLLIVLGGIVRASGSGLGCPDWPLCYGQLVPPGQPTAWIEYSHRVLAALTTGLAVSTAVLAIQQTGRTIVTLVALATPLLLALQIGLGAASVALELPPGVVMAHLALAFLLLGLLVFLVVSTAPVARSAGEAAPSQRFRTLATGALVAVYLLVLSGGYVRAAGAAWACAGFPLCNGDLWPAGGGRLVDVHLLHRFAVYAIGAHLLLTVLRAWRWERQAAGVTNWSTAVVACFLFQGAVGAIAVSTGVPPLAQALHVAGAGALWAATVGLFTSAHRRPVRETPGQSLYPGEAQHPPPGRRSDVHNLFLTSPARA